MNQMMKLAAQKADRNLLTKYVHKHDERYAEDALQTAELAEQLGTTHQQRFSYGF